MVTLLVLIACNGADPDPTDGNAPPPGPITAVQTWSPTVPTVAWIDWQAPANADSFVEFGLDEDFDRATPITADGAPSVPLLGLKAGRRYSWRAVSDTPSGRAESAVGDFVVPEAPSDLPVLSVTVREPDAQILGGYVLTSVNAFEGTSSGDSYAVIYDSDGAPVWWVPLDTSEVSVSPSFGATPGTVVWDRYDLSDSSFASTVTRIGIDGTGRVDLVLPEGHHAALEIDPDVITWISRDVRPSPYVTDTWVTADRIYEASVDEIGSAREVLNGYDDVFGGEYVAPCEHPGLPLVYDGVFPVFEWSHLNSIVSLPKRDALLIYLRWVDTILLLDRPTGDVLWTMGGTLGEFTADDGGPLFVNSAESFLSHAHFSQAWDGGFVAFDNGSHRVPPVSSLVEFSWDEAARTVTEVFRWNDPQGRFVGIVGDVRKLEGGNYLASWSVLGEVNEVGPDGVVRFQARTEPTRSLGRLAFASDLYAAVP